MKICSISCIWYRNCVFLLLLLFRMYSNRSNPMMAIMTINPIIDNTVFFIIFRLNILTLTLSKVKSVTYLKLMLDVSVLVWMSSNFKEESLNSSTVLTSLKVVEVVLSTADVFNSGQSSNYMTLWCGCKVWFPLNLVRV